MVLCCHGWIAAYDFTRLRIDCLRKGNVFVNCPHVLDIAIDTIVDVHKAALGPMDHKLLGANIDEHELTERRVVVPLVVRMLLTIPDELTCIRA